MNEWLNVIFRWTHLAAGVMWIGHLWFFNFVNAQLAKTYDPDSRKKVLPELMPRALYWFRWGAAYTWITGILLLFLVYWFGGVMVNPEQSMNPHAAGGIGLLLIIVGFAIYDALWKAMKNETAGAVISFVLVAVFALVLTRFMSGRAMYIHVGGLLGTIMAANVWMRIWPAQRKIIAGVKGTVEKMSLRQTVLRDEDGTVHIVPNSAIQIVSNTTRDWSQFPLRVVVAYSEPSEKIVKLLKEIGSEVRHDPEFSDDVVSDIDVPGIDRVGNGEAEYLILIKSRPNKQYRVSRELRRRIKACFEKNNVQAAGPGRIYVMDQGTGKAS